MTPWDEALRGGETRRARAGVRAPRWWLLLLTPAMLSCRKSTTVAFDTPFTLHVGQAARVSGSHLEVHFRRVSSDSRCPRGVECIQAGEAMVTLEGRLGGTAESFDVGLKGGSSSQGDGATYQGYRIWLLTLEPTPVAGRTVDSTAYVATLRVEKP